MGLPERGSDWIAGAAGPVPGVSVTATKRTAGEETGSGRMALRRPQPRATVGFAGPSLVTRRRMSAHRLPLSTRRQALKDRGVGPDPFPRIVPGSLFVGNHRVFLILARQASLLGVTLILKRGGSRFLFESERQSHRGCIVSAGSGTSRRTVACWEPEGGATGGPVGQSFSFSEAFFFEIGGRVGECGLSPARADTGFDCL